MGSPHATTLQESHHCQMMVLVRTWLVKVMTRVCRVKPDLLPQLRDRCQPTQGVVVSGLCEVEPDLLLQPRD